jgi:hypothetical protein
MKLILVEIAQSSTIGSNPKPVALVHMESPDVVNGQPLSDGKRCETTLVILEQSAASPNPEASFHVLCKTRYEIVFELLSVPPIEGREAESIEPGQSPLSSNPEIAIARRQNCGDGILGKTVVYLPVLMTVLRNGFRRIQSVGLAQHREHSKNMNE